MSVDVNAGVVCEGEEEVEAGVVVNEVDIGLVRVYSEERTLAVDVPPKERARAVAHHYVLVLNDDYVASELAAGEVCYPVDQQQRVPLLYSVDFDQTLEQVEHHVVLAGCSAHDHALFLQPAHLFRHDRIRCYTRCIRCYTRFILVASDVILTSPPPLDPEQLHFRLRVRYHQQPIVILVIQYLLVYLHLYLLKTLDLYQIIIQIQL